MHFLRSGVGTTVRRRAASCLVVVALVALAPGARACWDGYAAQGQRTRLAVVGGGDWEPARIRRVATWLARIDALLPESHELDSFERFAYVGPRGEPSQTIDWGPENFSELFEGVAKAVSASPKQRAWALSRRARPLTVQLLATRSEARAERFAVSIDEPGSGADSGFFEAGGFPSTNPRSHVVAEKDARGRTLYKVLVGAFLDRRQALEVASALEQATGMRGFVRRL